MFPIFHRVNASLELLILERGANINAILRHEAKFLMMGYPLAFLQEGVESNKQTWDRVKM